jgi:tyrosinase
MVSTRCSHVSELTSFITDASNFENSTFWDPDTTSGVGGWGDPNDDYQISDGGFATDFYLSYPSYHRLRRQYTPTTPNKPTPATDAFMPANITALVDGFVGDYIGFQARFESGAHGAVHRIVGGCVNLLAAPWFCPLTGDT